MLRSKPKKTQAGFSTLILIFYLIFIFVSFVGVMVSVVLVSKRQYATNLAARHSYYGAESYINHALFKVLVGGDWPTSGSYAGGSVVIEAEAEKFTISHISPRAKRTLEVTREETPGAPGQNVALMLILDCTGSMSDRVEGGDRRMKKAKDAVKSFLGALETDARFDEDSGLIGLMTFEKDSLSYQNSDEDGPGRDGGHTDFHLVPASNANMQNLIDWVNDFEEDTMESENYCRGKHETGYTNTAGVIWKATEAYEDSDPAHEFASFNILVTDGEPTGANLGVGGCEYDDKKSDEKGWQAIECLAENVMPNYPTRHFVVSIDARSLYAKAIDAFKKLVKVGGYDDSGYTEDYDALNLDQVLSQVKDEILTEETFYLREIEPEAD